MFRKSDENQQLDMFTNIHGMLQGSSLEQYKDEHSWHNQFYKHVILHIDEGPFEVLFNTEFGAPNASIKLLLGMMSLKEAFGWSDSQLFEQCRFNLLVRRSLGLNHIDDLVPAESTYYLLRKRVHDYNKESGTDLIEQVFQQITNYQALTFKVNGQSIRMDSKLIGSNIAKCSRYELVHDTLSLFFKNLDKVKYSRFSEQELVVLKKIVSTTGNKVVYFSNKEDLQEKLEKLGILIYRVLSLFEERDNKYYLILKRLFEEHYNLDEEEQIDLKPPRTIGSGTMQSPHDTECTYRDKDGVKVKGYSINITETCDDNSLNLITDIQIAKANEPDTKFVEPAIDNTTTVLGQTPENLHADGAFQSHDNTTLCKQREINHFFTGLQGPVGRYDLKSLEDQLVVTDLQTGEIIPSYKTKAGRWAIKTDNSYRYFTQKHVDICQLRRELEQMPIDKRKKRNNVEATIFQLSYHSRNNKTKYRGIRKHKMWAIFRCIWINVRRIMICTEKNLSEQAKLSQINWKRVIFNSLRISGLVISWIADDYYNIEKKHY